MIVARVRCLVKRGDNPVSRFPAACSPLKGGNEGAKTSLAEHFQAVGLQLSELVLPWQFPPTPGRAIGIG